MAQRVGVVLAGGAGRRLGRDKARLLVGDTALAARAADVLWPLCASVLVSIAPGAENPASGHPVVVDSPPAGRGPLAGIDAAFRATGAADLIVLACDYPRIERALLRSLLAMARVDDDVVVLTDSAGRDHPLVGLWRRRVAADVADAVGRGALKVRSLLGGWRVRRLGPADFPGLDLGRLLINVNRPEDLARLADPEAP